MATRLVVPMELGSANSSVGTTNLVATEFIPLYSVVIGAFIPLNIFNLQKLHNPKSQSNNRLIKLLHTI